MSVATWLDAPPVFIPRPACPHCGHPRWITVRSMARESDGSQSRRCVCRRCSQRFVLVFEIPEDSLPIVGGSNFPVGRLHTTTAKEF